MTTAKKEDVIGLKHKNYYLVGELPFGGGGESTGGFFQVAGGEKEQIFGWWGGTPPILPSREKSAMSHLCHY